MVWCGEREGVVRRGNGGVRRGRVGWGKEREWWDEEGPGMMWTYIFHLLIPVNTSLAAAAPDKGLYTRHWYTPLSDACTEVKVSVDWVPRPLYCTRLELLTAVPFASHAHIRGAVPVA